MAPSRRSAHRVHLIPRLRGPAGRIFPNWLAITIGRDILAWRDLDPAELAHELEHVRQWREHGVLFVPRYWLASLQAIRSGGHWYRDNAFEVAARMAAADAARSAVIQAAERPTPRPRTASPGRVGPSRRP